MKTHQPHKKKNKKRRMKAAAVRVEALGVVMQVRILETAVVVKRRKKVRSKDRHVLLE